MYSLRPLNTDNSYTNFSNVASDCARCSAGPSCRRHDPDRIRRPLNSFLVFRNEYVGINRQPEGQRKRKAPGFSTDKSLSTLAGLKWKAMSLREKKPYIDEANRLREEHRKMYPNYRYRPNRGGKKGNTRPKKSRTRLVKATPEPTNPGYTSSSISVSPQAAGPRFDNVLENQRFHLSSPVPNQPSLLGWSSPTESITPLTLTPLATPFDNGFTNNPFDYYYTTHMGHPNPQEAHLQYYNYNMEAPLSPQFYQDPYLNDDGFTVMASHQTCGFMNLYHVPCHESHN